MEGKKKKKTEAKEQHQDDYEQYDTVPKIKLVYDGICVKNSGLVKI